MRRPVTTDIAYPLTIFYDASCPLCRKEMQALCDYDTDSRLMLVDCSGPGFADADASRKGISTADMMRLIHARDADGRWFIGVDVFVIAYGAAGIEFMARFWSHRLLRPLWDRLYPWVARHRMGLSALGITGGFDRLLRWAARRSFERGRRCENGRCPSS